MDGITRIRNTLKAANLVIYNPGEHPAECKAAYIVVRQMGTHPTAETNKTGYTLAAVILYVPLDSHDQLATLAAQVKTLLAPLHAQVRPTGNTGADMIEQEYRAHSRSLEYMILKKLI